MSNHVKNVLIFRKLTKEDKEFILNTITRKAEDDSGYCIDFDKIIPEPQTEDDCPDDFKVNKDSHVMTDEDRPWFNWYDWHIKYWGTKWNAYDCYSLDQFDNLALVFNTAWSVPFPVMERLHLLGFDFDLSYADEDYGTNCGKLVYKQKDGFRHYKDSKLATPTLFAINLWEEY